MRPPARERPCAAKWGPKKTREKDHEVRQGLWKDSAVWADVVFQVAQHERSHRKVTVQGMSLAEGPQAKVSHRQLALFPALARGLCRSVSSPPVGGTGIDLKDPAAWGAPPSPRTQVTAPYGA